MNEVSQESIDAALRAVKALSGEQISKGGTPAMKVDSMVAEGAKTQVAAGSRPGEQSGWAGTSQKEVSGNGDSDAIDANATDYKGGAEKVIKGYLDQVIRGEITADRGLELVKAAKKLFGMEDEKEDEDEKDEKPEVKKSLVDAAAENETLQKGFEVSEFLEELVGTLSKSLDAMEERLASKLDGSIKKSGEFQVGLAKSLGHFGDVVAAQSQRLAQVEQGPARGPKSVQNLQVVEKSLGGASQQVSKGDLAKSLTDLALAGKVDSSEVLRFEASGQISERAHNLALAHLRGE